MPISPRDRRWKTAEGEVPPLRSPHLLAMLKRQCAQAAADLDEGLNALQRCERELSFLSKGPMASSAARSLNVVNRVREALIKDVWHQVHKMESDAYDMAAGQIVTAEEHPSPTALKKAKELSVKADEATKKAQALWEDPDAARGARAAAEKAAYEAHSEAAAAWLAVRLPPGKTPTPEAMEKRRYHNKRYHQHYEAWMHSPKR